MSFKFIWHFSAQLRNTLRQRADDLKGWLTGWLLEAVVLNNLRDYIDQLGDDCGPDLSMALGKLNETLQRGFPLILIRPENVNDYI